jgi:hypothetical protein
MKPAFMCYPHKVNEIVYNDLISPRMSTPLIYETAWSIYTNFYIFEVNSSKRL